jgi:hypothetical protein
MKERAQKVLFFFAAAAMMLILLWGGWGRNRFLFGADTFTQHLPFFLFAKKVWTLYHELPLWMPDIFMGMPAIDSANLIYFYPTNLLYVLLPVPVEQVYVIDLVIHMAAAAFGMYLLLKRHRIRPQAAFFGALVYMFSGPLVTYAYNGHWLDIKALAMAPYVLYFLNMGIEKKRFFFFLTAGLFMALQFLATGMQVGAYTYIAAVVYGAYLLYEKKAGKDEIISCAAMFGAASAAAALFSAPQFFPAQDYMKYSWRKYFSYGEFTNISLPPAETLTLLLPQFFGLKDQMYWGELQGMSMSYYCGLAPFLLAFFAFFSAKYRKDAIFFLCLGILFTILSYGGHTPLYKLLYYVPVFNKFRNPARAMSMIPLVLSFMAAAGLNSLVFDGQDTGDKERNKRALILTAKWLGAVAVVLIILTASENVLKGIVSGLFVVTRGTDYNVTMPPGADAALAALIRQDALFFIVTGGLFLVLVYARLAGKIKSLTVFILLLACLQFADIYRIERQFISYKTIKEVAGDDPAAGYIMKSGGIFRSADLNFAWYPNRSMYYGLESFMGFHGIIMDKMYNLLGSNAYTHINILRLFNIRYYLDTGYPEEYKQWGLKKVIDGPVKLFEDRNYLPRAFFTSRIRSMKNDDEILSYMEGPRFNPMEVLTKDDIKLAGNQAKGVASVEITEYMPNRIRITAKSNKEGVLVLSNMYYPRWKVMVDKKPGKIYNVDYALSGVRLSAGEHELDFYYDRGFIIACIGVMAAAFLAYLAVFYFEFRRKKTE